MSKEKKLKEGDFMKGEYLGYDWMVARMEMGHLCGYVRLWDGHPLELLWKSEKYPYDEIDVDCHGGLTFARKLTKKDIIAGFTPGYWIGWDYAHAGDEMIIWEESEVVEECKSVIKQLVEKYPKRKKKEEK